MPEPIGYHLHRHLGRMQRQGCAGMPQAVRRDRLDVRGLEHPPEMQAGERIAGLYELGLRTIIDGRERDREFDRQQQLVRQRHLLLRGELLRAPGDMYPRLDYLDQRIAELKHTIAVMRGNLQHYVEQAEQLLAATTATG